MTRGQAHDVTDSLDIGRRGLSPSGRRRGRATTLSTTPHGREHRTIVLRPRNTRHRLDIEISDMASNAGSWQSLFHYR